MLWDRGDVTIAVGTADQDCIREGGPGSGIWLAARSPEVSQVNAYGASVASVDARYQRAAGWIPPMATTAQDARHRTTWRTWLAIAIFGIAVSVAFILPTYYGGCRPGWYPWRYGTAASSFFCGLPPPSDDFGYSPHNLLPLKIAIGMGGALLARAVVMAGRECRGVAAGPLRCRADTQPRGAS